jgi:hypothetical protein
MPLRDEPGDRGEHLVVTEVLTHTCERRLAV